MVLNLPGKKGCKWSEFGWILSTPFSGLLVIPCVAQKIYDIETLFILYTRSKVLGNANKTISKGDLEKKKETNKVWS